MIEKHMPVPALQALAMGGNLGTLKNDELKAYLRAKQLKIGGTKPELIVRIMDAEGVPQAQ